MGWHVTWGVENCDKYLKKDILKKECKKLYPKAIVFVEKFSGGEHLTCEVRTYPENPRSKNDYEEEEIVNMRLKGSNESDLNVGWTQGFTIVTTFYTFLLLSKGKCKPYINTNTKYDYKPKEVYDTCTKKLKAGGHNINKKVLMESIKIFFSGKD